MAKVTIDGVNFDTDTMSQESRQQLEMLMMTEQRMRMPARLRLRFWLRHHPSWVKPSSFEGEKCSHQRPVNPQSAWVFKNEGFV
ncbi:MAG: hypothetical protein EBU75_09005 [Betaproteobacteria bacterium]|nr:hypothetical protein [Betaproteobacteria bacterium]